MLKFHPQYLCLCYRYCLDSLALLFGPRGKQLLGWGETQLLSNVCNYQILMQYLFDR